MIDHTKKITVEKMYEEKQKVIIDLIKSIANKVTTNNDFIYIPIEEIFQEDNNWLPYEPIHRLIVFNDKTNNKKANKLYFKNEKIRNTLRNITNLLYKKDLFYKIIILNKKKFTFWGKKIDTTKYPDIFINDRNYVINSRSIEDFIYDIIIER